MVSGHTGNVMPRKGLRFEPRALRFDSIRQMMLIVVENLGIQEA